MATPVFGKPGGRIPYLEGPVGMDQRIFNVARDVVEHPMPPGHKLPIDVYAACMVIEYLTRKIVNQQHGREPGAYFVCPECRNDMSYNNLAVYWQCIRCNQMVTDAQIKIMFHPGIYIPPGGNTKVDPEKYEPSLTRPLPRELEVEKLKQIQENAAEEEEPVVLYRSWKLVVNDTDADTGELRPRTSPMLMSINNVVWEPRHPLRAVHWPGGHTHDEKQGTLEELADTITGGCPNWYCNCGIYGVKTLHQAQQWGRSSPPPEDGKPITYVQVLGKVVFWGKVLQFETGAKAQYAYPEKLWLSPTVLGWAAITNPDRLSEDLSARYGIPVELEDGMFNLGLSHT